MKIRNFIVVAMGAVFVVAAMGNAAFAKGPDPMQQQQQMQQQVPVKMAPPPPGMPMPGMGMPSAQHNPDQHHQQSHQKVRYIRVHRGDTLTRIAVKFHMRVIQLKRLNHLRGDRIFVGQRLRVR